ncbi:hypothetical protein SLG_24250 [Sphingobium sp. SYK-6]|nr:hypothetical protein SLG_24250 [Sphingobium sp. SYK-6]
MPVQHGAAVWKFTKMTTRPSHLPLPVRFAVDRRGGRRRLLRQGWTVSPDDGRSPMNKSRALPCLLRCEEAFGRAATAEGM